jgi:hypothetical protein
MRLWVDIFKALLVLVVFATTHARAQEPTPTPKPRECSTPVYKSKEVDRKVKIFTFPSPKFDDREFENYPFSRIILQTIFCGSGEVTDVKVHRGISPKLDQEAIRTAKTIKFRPAEKNGEKVAQWMTLEYHLKR